MVHSPATYERIKERARVHHVELRQISSEIGDLPPIVDPKRRAKAEKSLRVFCEQYRPDAFNLAWSPDHLKILTKTEETIRNGGLFAMAMPRGSGKTTITITAAIWALLCGYRHWVCLIGSTADKAQSLLKSIKTVLRFNDELYADFPEVCVPLRILEGKANKCVSQTYHMQHTNCVWSIDELVFPTMPGYTSSGGRVSVAGIVGDIRGKQDTTSGGAVVRPDYVIADDPQTRESAKSRLQTADRLATVNGDILGLAGPGVKISGIIPCTVIHKGDLADQLLDRTASPLWQGVRTQLLYGWPKNIKLWDEYFEMRNLSYQNDGCGEEATAFYKTNQVAMDEGCTAAWPERFNLDELTAIQAAMNIYGADAAAFHSEYQNEPLQLVESNMLTSDEVSARQNSYGRDVVPIDSEYITAFIDVQKELLFYTIIAWQKDFTGWVLDYGSWPDQKTTNFVMSRARYTFSKLWPKESLEVHLQRAFTALTEELAAKVYVRDDKTEVGINIIGIDCNWGQSRDITYNFARHAKHRNLIMPCNGKYVGPEAEPLNARHISKHRGKSMGLHWRIAKAKDAPIRHLLYDTNFWKSFLHTRFGGEPNTSGSLTLYKPTRNKQHDTFAAHITAEYPVRVIGRQREVDVWRLRPERPDNHYFDCSVGCAVLASTLGCKTFTANKEMIAETLPDGTPVTPIAKPVKKKKQKVSYL